MKVIFGPKIDCRFIQAILDGKRLWILHQNVDAYDTFAIWNWRTNNKKYIQKYAAEGIYLSSYYYPTISIRYPLYSCTRLIDMRFIGYKEGAENNLFSLSFRGLDLNRPWAENKMQVMRSLEKSNLKNHIRLF